MLILLTYFYLFLFPVLLSVKLASVRNACFTTVMLLLVPVVVVVVVMVVVVTTAMMYFSVFVLFMIPLSVKLKSIKQTCYLFCNHAAAAALASTCSSCT